MSFNQREVVKIWKAAGLGSGPPIPGVTYSTLLLFTVICAPWLPLGGLAPGFYPCTTDPTARISTNEQVGRLLWGSDLPGQAQDPHLSGRPSFSGEIPGVNLPGAEHQDGSQGGTRNLGR